MTRAKRLLLLAIAAPMIYGPGMVLVMYLKLKDEGAYLVPNDEYMAIAVPIVQTVLTGTVCLTLGVWFVLAVFGILTWLLTRD
jgi:hypothetical protein